MRVKIESHLFDELANAIMLARENVGGGSDEEEAMNSLIKTAVVILGCAHDDGWDPPPEIAVEIEKIIGVDEED